MECVPFLPHLVTQTPDSTSVGRQGVGIDDVTGPGNRQNPNERRKCVLISSFYNYDMLQVSGGIAGLESS